MGSPLKVAVEKVLRAAGNEAIVFKNGSRVDVLASTEAAGHGRTVDLGVIDEAFADTDYRREQALLPAMATRPAAQILVVSTAGTEASVFLKHKVDTGRAAATML
jgi:lactam utilization protein B